MANRIKIRHGSSTPTTSNLLPYELGWDETNLALYINNNGTREKVGGRGLFLPLSGGTMTGRLTTPGITINSTDGTAHLQFSRTSWNYIIIPFVNGGSLSLANSVAAADIYYDFTKTGCLPGTTDTYTLGSSTKKWSSVYATDFIGHLTGAADYIRITDTTPTVDTYYYPTFTIGKTVGTNYVERASDKFRYWIKSDGSINYFMIGDDTTNGRLRLYDGTSGKYVNMYVNTTLTANRSLYLPDVSGTLITTAGGTLTGNLTISGTDLGIYAYDTQSKVKVALQVGSGHINHGIYSYGYTSSADTTANNESKWLLYRGSDGNTVIPGKFSADRARLTATTDASGTAANNVALIIGSETGSHLEFDNNEILMKNDSTTPGTLYLQDGTGTVDIAGSGGLKISKGNIVIEKTTPILTVKNTASSVNVSAHFEVASSGNHGIYSSGYVGNSSAKWVIYRNGSDGLIYIPWGVSGNVVLSDTCKRIFTATSATKPSAAVAGDIVLVKA